MRKLSLRFEPVLEACFERDSHAVWRREGLVTGWVGLFLYDFFLYVDYIFAPSLVWRSAFVRLALFTPTALACLYLMGKVRRRYVLDAGKMVMIVFGVAGLLVITVASSIVAATINQASLMAILFGALIFRMSMPFAVVTNIIFVAEEMVFIGRTHVLTREHGITFLLLVMACMAVSLLANYRLERSERRSYLLLLEGKEQQLKLRQLNTALEELSSRDGLTGLPNRRRFDEYSRTASEAAWREGLPVSIVMADIDHFKRFNDTFGHLVGDGVLIQVAEAVRSCVRGGNDLAARFGGEEFVLILPGADQAEAILVAERAVATVHGLVMRIPGSDQPVAITLSCGVATDRAGGTLSLTDLIGRADRALYQAKREGRNRICQDMANLDLVPAD